MVNCVQMFSDSVAAKRREELKFSESPVRVSLLESVFYSSPSFDLLSYLHCLPDLGPTDLFSRQKKILGR